jgi:RES domain-containing protein
MHTFRIARSKWAHIRTGSMIAGRWNRAGDKMIYTASSLALALLEVLVHVKLDQVPTDYVWVAAEFNQKLIERVEELPGDPAEYGSAWLHKRGGKVVLAVPSVILPERNFLMNPDHTDFSKIKWGEPMPLEIDSRLTQSEAKSMAGQPQSVVFAKAQTNKI